ncbi:sensor histidine kinase [Curvivirga aplysinae]|uniref:sensor histidine kinase n=1 Tax=Curvivirga aplysinae TaxID=2529852 RepID=UPI0012BB6A9C|nr:HAMP domain-containing sensor histidine kinase [Curvivirga aplysinae]MTI11191.1 HAMP domain-containing histidine kinase [Curvivirga aplysinae]
MTDKSSKTLLKKAETALEAAIEENKRVRLSNAQRMGEIAHEIKNALNSMMGFSEILKNEQFGAHSDPRYKEYADFIHESTQHLLQICERELTQSKNQNLLNAQPLPTQKIDVNVNDVIDTTITGLSSLAHELEVDIKIQVDEDFPILKTDPARLRQVLHNLVSNAIKFTPKGGHVCVKAIVDREEGALILVVKDNGFGVSAEDILKIMEPFEQIEDMEKRGDQGSGLGLPIVKRLVDEMGAELEFRSRKNVGTMVTLKFSDY